MAGVRWIAWGLRIEDGEQEPYILGELECKSHILAALVNARRRYGLAVDHVQSVLSHEIDLLESRSKLVFKRRHPRPYHKRRKPEKRGEALNGAGTLNNVMSSGNT